MLDAAAVLVEHGAQNEPSCGAAALHAAVHASRVDVVERLLQGGITPLTATMARHRSTSLRSPATSRLQNCSCITMRRTTRATKSAEKRHCTLQRSSRNAMSRASSSTRCERICTSTSAGILHAAAIHADPPVLQLLIERGAQTDATWRLGATSLHEAAARGIAESVAMLLRGGAPSAQEDVYGDAASRGRRLVDIRKLQSFIQLGRAPLSSNKFGITALHAVALVATGWWPRRCIASP